VFPPLSDKKGGAKKDTNTNNNSTHAKMIERPAELSDEDYNSSEDFETLPAAGST
jgi:hypothetical protein